MATEKFLDLEEIKVGSILEIEFSFATKQTYLVLSVKKTNINEFHFSLFNIALNKIYRTVVMFNSEFCVFAGKVKII